MSHELVHTLTDRLDNEWVAYLFKPGGVIKPLYPVHLNCFCQTKTEVIERMRIYLSAHPEIRDRWRGCAIVAVNYADRIDITHNGSLIL